MSQVNHLQPGNSSRLGGDMDKPLADIRAGYSNPNLATQLVRIQAMNLPQQKSLDFLKKLNCLYFKDASRFGTGRNSMKPKLDLVTIDAFRHNYVALSYTWQPSPEEINVSDGGYLVQDIQSGQREPSSVRNRVFSRIKRYMDYRQCKFLWIDKHCIIQEEGKEKEIGMQAMDRVYSLSKYPAALLSRNINTLEQLQLLTDILSGGFVTRRGGKYLPSSPSYRRSARDAFQLLHYITSDTWFSKGWTYQENYRANNNMKLLITHSPSLNHQKPSDHFESLNGELLISSKDLHEKATELCLAYSNFQPTPPHLTTIFSRAERYQISLRSSDGSAPVSMSPTIIEDITSRQIEREWDRLAIIANCCQYTKRLDSTQLQRDNHSLSLSLLTLVLMNGEILDNGPRKKVDVGKMTITEFLHKHFFYGLDCPRENAKLTFNKGCRFANVVLTDEGVRTKGYLWRFEGEISTTSFRNYSYSHTRKRKRSQQPLQGPLEWLAEQLDEELPELSQRLQDILSECPVSPTPSKRWMLNMADKVEEAIEQGRLLYTAELVGSDVPGFAVFIAQAEDTDTDSEMSVDSDGHDGHFHVFTSFDSAQIDHGVDFNDLDKHVSLQVNYDIAKGGVRVPRLYTRHWIHGLCFNYDCSPRPVVFPWPVSLTDP
ncbi:uncharacterized protein FFFS_03065 [Fusarium fujikuroi]|nr:uncharacterized protein FFFS_03065 [Fusarium fujikuroi]